MLIQLKTLVVDVNGGVDLVNLFPPTDYRFSLDVPGAIVWRYLSDLIGRTNREPIRFKNACLSAGAAVFMPPTVRDIGGGIVRVKVYLRSVGAHKAPRYGWLEDVIATENGTESCGLEILANAAVG